jgi:hypothetical protein
MPLISKGVDSSTRAEREPIRIRASETLERSHLKLEVLDER